jgi:hypothetical protein
LCCYHCVLCKSYFQHFQNFHISFLQFKGKFDADTLFVQVSHFVGTVESRLEQHTHVPSKTVLNSCMCYSLIWSRKWLSTARWSFMIAAVMSPCSQSRNYFVTPWMHATVYKPLFCWLEEHSHRKWLHEIWISWLINVMVFRDLTPWRWMQHVPLKCWCLSTNLYSVTWLGFLFTILTTSDLVQ